MFDAPKVIRVFGSLYDLFFGDGFEEDKWTRIAIKGENISHVKGRELGPWLNKNGSVIIELALKAKQR